MASYAQAMSQFFQSMFQSDGMKARVMRGSVLTLFGFGSAQALRLASNLILTRLLFPEAFGLMAIIQLFIIGMQMFTDVGLNSVIVQSKRGDDPAFLNTCWTLQIIRGGLLGLLACAIAAPVAAFYDQEILYLMMMAVGLNAFIQGFVSTRMWTANRNVTLGRMTLLELAAQAVSIAVMIVFALLFQSVWALMAGVLAATVVKVILSHLILPGAPNRIEWDAPAFWEQFNFGKFIFISSAMSFLVSNGDRVVLSKYIDLETLGFYNIAFFFGTLPIMVMHSFVGRIFFPLYSSRPPSESKQNRAAISKVRFMLTGSMFALLVGLALMGDWLIGFLYSAEYRSAGPILVILALTMMPKLIFQSYDFILLSKGNSKVYTAFLCLSACVQMILLLIGVTNFGLIGAMLAPALSNLLIYPVLFWLIRPYHGTDSLHDIIFAALATVSVIFVLYVNEPALSAVLQISQATNEISAD